MTWRDSVFIKPIYNRVIICYNIIMKGVIKLVIQPKKKPMIKRGTGYIYKPDTFAKEHKQINFFDIDTPEELL